MTDAFNTASAVLGPDPLLALGAMVVVAALYLAWKAWRPAPPMTPPTPERAPAADLTNMVILFQTLRDVLQQQKDLARDFNASLDRKVGLIRQTADAALQNLEALRETKRKLVEELEELRAELAGLRIEAAALRGRPAAPVPPPDPAPAVPRELSDPVLRVVASRPDEPDPDDLIDHWVSFDLGTDSAEPDEAPDVPDPVLEPEDPEQDRMAFRALLDLGDEGADPAPPELSGDGRGLSPALRARVFEYHDAGMSLAQIAQELGIGKGEVRLILNLRGSR